jgi:hypothetical protein
VPELEHGRCGLAPLAVVRARWRAQGPARLERGPRGHRRDPTDAQRHSVYIARLCGSTSAGIGVHDQQEQQTSVLGQATRRGGSRGRTQRGGWVREGEVDAVRTGGVHGSRVDVRGIVGRARVTHAIGWPQSSSSSSGSTCRTHARAQEFRRTNAGARVSCNVVFPQRDVGKA